MGLKVGKYTINRYLAILIVAAVLLFPIADTMNWYLAAVLLIGRLLIVTMLVKIIRQQFKYLSATNNPELNPLRKDLFRLGVIFAGGQLAPIVLDSLVVLGINRVGWMIIIYALSNLASTFAAVALIGKIYEDRTEVVAVFEDSAEYHKGDIRQKEQ